MDFLSVFSEIIKDANDQERPRNQILGNLNFITSKLKEDVKTYEKFMEELRSSDQGLINQAVYVALEYNNALLLSSLRPNNFLDLLKKAVEEKRYYFFFTASEMILAKNINSKQKTDLLSYVNYIKDKLGLTLTEIKTDIYDEIIVILNKLLEIALDDFYLFRTISTKVIEPYVLVHDSYSKHFIGEVTFDNLRTLYSEIMRYANALGLKKGE